MPTEKLYRLFELLKLLNTGRPNVAYLATALNVCRRTILRDIDELRDIGFRIEFDSEMQRYVITGSSMLPSTSFTLEESLAMLLLCFEAGGDIPFLNSARMAAIKLQNILPRRIQEQVRELGNAMQIRPLSVTAFTDSRSLFEELIESIRRRRAVRIQYKSPVEPVFQTLLSPYQLFFARHSWYVIGRSSIHRETRLFHLGRIRSCEPVEHAYEIPKGFSLKQFFGNAWCMIREPGKDREVVVRFSPLVAQNVSEVRWHSTQRLLWNEDGSLDYHVTVSGLGEISWWILGYGKEAEVLKPQKLREMLREHAEEMLRRYR